MSANLGPRKDLQSFILKVKTDNSGETNDDQFEIPTSGVGYNYTVDWGDNNIDENVTGVAIHTYDIPGEYIIKIKGDFPRILFNNSGDKDKLLEIKQWGNIEWLEMESAFFGCSNLDVTATDVPNFSSSLTSLRNMFGDCVNLKGNLSFNIWDISNIQLLGGVSGNQRLGIFQGCTNFNQPLGNWDTSNVIDLRACFYYCSNFNQDLGSWDVSNVELMGGNNAQGRESGIFSGCISFNNGGSDRIKNWNTSKVIHLHFAFSGCTNFNQPLNWDTSNVITMRGMFGPTFGNSHRVEKFNQDLDWNTSKVTNMTSMFNRCRDFNGDISSWDVSKVEDFNFMFELTESFNRNINSWVTSSITELISTFRWAVSFNQPLNNWDVSNVTSFGGFNRGMFESSNFNQPLDQWDVRSATNMRNMFRSNDAFDQNLSNWEPISLTIGNDWLIGGGLSTANYDALLIAWSNLTLQNDVNFHAGNSKYTSAGETAKNSIITNYNWSFTDGGLEN